MTVSLTPDRARALLDALPGIARRAGREIMRVYASDFEVRGKSDASPVTEADEASERVILSALSTLAPDILTISEEACAANGLPEAEALHWLIDPLDGTREFVDRNGEFTVNIALIADGRPVLGVVYTPALEVMYAGGEGQGAWREAKGERRAIRVRKAPPEGLTVLASRSHGDEAALQAYFAGTGARIASIARVGSSLKLGVLAAGQADLYPRFGRTMEWDIAAGHAVLAAAGGRVRTLDGAELTYGKRGCENPHFIAMGGPSLTGHAALAGAGG